MAEDAAIAQQARTFSAISDIHGSPREAQQYFTDHYFTPRFYEGCGVRSSGELQLKCAAEVCAREPERTKRFVSLGAGECREEIVLCQRLVKAGHRRIQFECVDIAPGAIERARDIAWAEGVAGYFEFSVGAYDALIESPADVVIANQVLHHFTDLENLFDKIKIAIGDHGIFLTNDMIGRNGHMLWPEALAIVDRLWERLDDKYKFNRCLGRFEPQYANWDNSKECNEGIRAQDILPELLTRFHFDYFFAGSNICHALFGTHFGPNFDPENEDDRAIIEQVAQLDFDLIDIGYLKPVAMLACMSNGKGPSRYYRHWSPGFCARTTSPLPSAATTVGYAEGDTLAFSERNPATDCLGEGWSSPEPGGVWSNAPQSRVLIPLRTPLPAGMLRLTIAGMQFAPPNLDMGAVEVLLNGTSAGKIRFSGHLEGNLTAAVVECQIEASTAVEVTLRYDRCVAPVDIGMGDQVRRLALHLAFMELSGHVPNASPKKKALFF